MALCSRNILIPSQRTWFQRFIPSKAKLALFINDKLHVLEDFLPKRLHHNFIQSKRTEVRSLHFFNCLKFHQRVIVGPHPSVFTQCICQYSKTDDYSDDEADRPENKLDFPDAELDWKYIIDPNNIEEIKQNIVNRKGIGNIDEVHRLWGQHKDLLITHQSGPFTEGQDFNIHPLDFFQNKDDDEAKLQHELLEAALLLPNTSHPDAPVGDESAAKLIEVIGQENKRDFDFKPRTMAEIGECLHALRTSDMTLTTGHGTYYLQGPYAELEQALIRYTVNTLLEKGLKMMSVPDLIYPEIIKGCGFTTTGERNQVYRLEPEKYGRDVCLAGTGEMPLAAFSMNYTFTRDQLPQKVITVSRCYRAETSSVEEEKGIYRVHQFTKVEMFGITADDSGQESQELLDEFLQIQRDIFSPLGFCYRIMEMPTHELGAPAYRKYDMEAWMPAKSMWGEISSTSNCTDYQSRRLSIKYWGQESEVKHCHTVNGTACAIPRMIMAIVEANQQKDLSVNIPAVLQPYMDGKTSFSIPEDKVIMKPIKFTKSLKKNIKNSQK